MAADDVAVLIAASTAAVATVTSLVVVVSLGRRVRDLRRLVEVLAGETVPLVRDARVVVEEAATEMVRVGDVLGSAESVSATVDSASRLAYRAFSNPVVKVLAFGTGTGSALRRLVGRGASEPGAAAAATNGQRHRSGPGPAPHRVRRRRGAGTRR